MKRRNGMDGKGRMAWNAIGRTGRHGRNGRTECNGGNGRNGRNGRRGGRSGSNVRLPPLSAASGTVLSHTQLFPPQLRPTQLFHSHLFHTQLFHTQLSHTQFCHTQLFHTRSLVTHAQLCPTQSLSPALCISVSLYPCIPRSPPLSLYVCFIFLISYRSPHPSIYLYYTNSPPKTLRDACITLRTARYW